MIPSPLVLRLAWLAQGFPIRSRDSHGADWRAAPLKRARDSALELTRSIPGGDAGHC